MPLNFNEHIVAPESFDQKLRAIRRVLGSARASRANASPARTNGVLAIANFSGRSKSIASCESSQRLFRRDAETSTRDACATQKHDQPFRKLRQLIPSH